MCRDTQIPHLHETKAEDRVVCRDERHAVFWGPARGFSLAKNQGTEGNGIFVAELAGE